MPHQPGHVFDPYNLSPEEEKSRRLLRQAEDALAPAAMRGQLGERGPLQEFLIEQADEIKNITGAKRARITDPDAFGAFLAGRSDEFEEFTGRPSPMRQAMAAEEQAGRERMDSVEGRVLRRVGEIGKDFTRNALTLQAGIPGPQGLLSSALTGRLPFVDTPSPKEQFDALVTPVVRPEDVGFVPDTLGARRVAEAATQLTSFGDLALTGATAGLGPAVARSVANPVARALLSPIVKGGLPKRLGAETAAGIGAVIGFEELGKLAPDNIAAQLGLGLVGGLGGAVGGIAGFRGATEGIPAAIRAGGRAAEAVGQTGVGNVLQPPPPVRTQGRFIPEDIDKGPLRVFISTEDVAQGIPLEGIPIAGAGEAPLIDNVRGQSNLVRGQIRTKQDLPETVFHVTSDAARLRNTNILRASSGEGGGLGGPTARNTVSFTSSANDADDIATELIRIGEVARAGSNDEAIVIMNRIISEDAQRAGVPAEAIGEADEIVSNIYGVDWRTRGNLSRVEIYRAYLIRRDTRRTGQFGEPIPGLRQDPIIFMNDVQAQKIMPESVEVIEVSSRNLPDEALITDRVSGDFLNEIQVHGDVDIRGVRPAPDAPTPPVQQAARAADAGGGLGAAQTGQPFRSRLFRGSGRAEGDDVLNPLLEGEGDALFGSARYSSPDQRFAGEFGPNVEQIETTLQNPLVIRTDAEYAAIIEQAGISRSMMGRSRLTSPGEFTPAQNNDRIAQFRQFVEGRGHDGIVIDPAPGDAARRMLEDVGDAQVVEFNPQRLATPDVPPVRAAEEVAGGAARRAELGFAEDNPLRYIDEIDESRDPEIRRRMTENYQASAFDRNTMTAWYEGGVEVPTEELARLPGARGEEAWQGADLAYALESRARIVASIRERGFDPAQRPLIVIEPDGRALVYEGNQRIAAAAEVGLERVPVDVRYFGSSERLPNVFDPANFPGSRLPAAATPATPPVRAALKPAAPGEADWLGPAVADQAGLDRMKAAKRSPVARRELINEAQEANRQNPGSVPEEVAEYASRETAAPDGGPPPPPPPKRGSKQPPEADPSEILKRARKSRLEEERFDQRLLIQHEAAIANAERQARIVVNEGNDELLAANLGGKSRGTVVPRNQTDIDRFDNLLEALNEPSRVRSGELTVEPALRKIYDDLRADTDFEQAARIDFDPEMATVDDYFYRGWKPPEMVVNAKKDATGKLVTPPDFTLPRVDASYREMRNAGFEPLFWNPYEQARLARMQGVKYRQQMELVEALKELDDDIIRPKLDSTNETGFRVPEIGPAFEGKPFALTPVSAQVKDVSGGGSAVQGTMLTELKARRWIVRNDVANLLETMYGKKPSLGTLSWKVGTRTRNKAFETDILKVIDWLVFIPKRIGLFGTFFQQLDFLTRAGFGSFGNAVDLLARGKPIKAAQAIIKYPQIAAEILAANVSATRRRTIMEAFDSTKPLIEGRNVSLKSISDEGLSVRDVTIFPEDMDVILREAAQDRSIVDPRRAGRAIAGVERAMRAGLFQGVYPAAVKADVENNIAPQMARLYGDELTDAQLSARIAKAANIKYSTIPASQSALQNRFIRETTKRGLFSVAELEGLLRQATNTIKGPGRKYWAANWLGGYIFLMVVANIIHTASTGKILPRERYSPVSKGGYGPLPIGYNTRFAAPTVPGIARGGLPVTLDIVGQMDTAFRVLDPKGFVGSRFSIPVRAAVNQWSGEDFFERPINDVGPGGVISRTTALLLDMFSPFGAGPAAEEVAREFVPGADVVIPRGESRLGLRGLGIQALGINLRSMNNDELIEALNDFSLPKEDRQKILDEQERRDEEAGISIDRVLEETRRQNWNRTFR